MTPNAIKKRVEVYGVPMDLGANLRGVDMGPTALRIAGIVEAIAQLGYEVGLTHEFKITSRVNLPPDVSKSKYVAEIAAACDEIAKVARECVASGAMPVFLGGDHSIAIGTVGGVADYHRERGEKIGLIWFDAHADMNTPESTVSGNVHGMPLSAILGLGDAAVTELLGWRTKVAPVNTVIVGARDLDAKEREIVRSSGVTMFSMSAIDTMGMAEITRQAIAKAGDGTAGIYLSFDIDGLDPSFAPGVGTPVRGGVSFREAHLFMEMLAESKRLLGLDVVELNPIKDVHNATAEVAVHLVQSVFGRRIY